MARQVYDTDMTDTQWDVVLQVFPASPSNNRGRPREHSIREILNAILYILTAGCVWRLFPHDLPPWKTAYHYFRLWSKNGTLKQVHRGCESIQESS